MDNKMWRSLSHNIDFAGLDKVCDSTRSTAVLGRFRKQLQRNNFTFSAREGVWKTEQEMNCFCKIQSKPTVKEKVKL